MGQKRNTDMSMEREILNKLKAFLENEARSCSMDFGCVTPEYVYRMWGGTVPLNDILEAFKAQATESRADAAMRFFAEQSGKAERMVKG